MMRHTLAPRHRGLRLLSFLTLLAEAAGVFADTRTATLVWELGGDPTATGTFLYWGKVQDPPLVASAKIDLPGRATSYSFTNLVDDTTYYFYVTAYNAAGLESVPSNRALFRSQQTTAPQAAELDLSLLTTNTSLIDPLSFDLVGGHPELGSGAVFYSSSTGRVYCPPAINEVAALRFRFEESVNPELQTDALVRIYVGSPQTALPTATPPYGPVLVAPGSTVDIPLIGRGTGGEALVASRIDLTLPSDAGTADYGPGLLRFTAAPGYFGEFAFAYNVLSADGTTESPFATVLVRVVPRATSAGFAIANGLPQLSLQGPPRAIYAIHRSQDLLNWDYVGSVVTTNGFTASVPFLDAHASTVPAAFYRSQFAGYVP
jgi:hypothetical protein